MKRFWREVTIDAHRGVLLDARPVRTPGRSPLQLPTDALAAAVAAEWRAVGETLDPRAMPLTGLANRRQFESVLEREIDRVARIGEPALVLLVAGHDPTRLLILSQVVLSFGIPFALVPLIWLTSKKSLMCAWVNRRVTTVACALVAALVIGLNAYLLVSFLR